MNSERPIEQVSLRLEGKGTGRMAQVVECLCSRHEALSSNPSTTKNKAHKKKDWKEKNL
jgi:hypothetical protein